MHLIRCAQCLRLYKTLEDFEVECGESHNWEDWEGDRFHIIGGLSEEQAEFLLSSQETILETLSDADPYPYTYGPLGPYSPPQISPYYPYYPPKGFYSTPIRGVFRKGGVYYCAIHRVKLPNLTSLLEHLKKKHKLEDYILGLKLAIKEKYKRILNLQGRREEAKTLDKMSDNEVLSLLLREWVREPENKERLGTYVDTQLNKLSKYLSGELEFCPLCGLTSSNQLLTKGFEVKRIIEDLAINTKAYRKFIKGYKEARQGKKVKEAPTDLLGVLKQLHFSATFYGKPVKVSLDSFIHLSLNHLSKFKNLITSKALSFKDKRVCRYVLEEKWNQEKRTTKAKEQLMKMWIESKNGSPFPKLDKNGQIWIWLKKEKHEKERTYSKS